MKKNLLICLLCLAMGAVLLGCGSKTEETEAPTTAATEAPTETETATVPVVEVPEITTEEETEPEETEEVLPEGYMRSYLTGEVVPVEVGTLRPVAVQIDNERKAQPQNGVAQAEIVYEVPIEAYEVRITAIFQDLSTVGRIGPIRSARVYHVGIINEFEAFITHVGCSKYAKEYLLNERVGDLDAIRNCWSVIYEADDHISGHHDFTTQERIENAIAKLEYDRNFSEDFTGKFLFAKDDEPTELENGIDANTVNTNYKQNHSYFVYDSETQKYLRYAYGSAHVDQDNDEQVAVDNIIVQYTTYKHFESTTENKDIKTVGDGEGWFITHGKAVPITWEKTDFWDDITRYYDENGDEIVLNQGKTWVCIVLPSLTGEITIE